jgi:hypothetical protein
MLSVHTGSLSFPNPVFTSLSKSLKTLIFSGHSKKGVID